jgi:plasmid maintenance system antidote protein VapI
MTTSKNKQKVKRPSAYPDLKSYIIMQIRLTERGCWEWPVYHKKGGYAEVQVGGERILLHRLSYELFKGEIMEGCQVFHRCDNPRCVNPEHLFSGKPKMNMGDMMRKGRGRSKLSVEEVVRIKNLFRCGKRSMGSLAREFGVTQQAIRNLIRGESWLGVGVNLKVMSKKVIMKSPAKLTAEQVVEIRGLLESGVTQTEIAERFGVSRRTIYAIREGETWRGGKGG